MAPPQLSSNTAPILALVGAEILSLMAFVGVCEVRAKDFALCESRWALAREAAAPMAVCRQQRCVTYRPPTVSGSSAPTKARRTGTMRWLLDLAIAFLALGAVEAVVKPLARRFCSAAS